MFIMNSFGTAQLLTLNCIIMYIFLYILMFVNHLSCATYTQFEGTLTVFGFIILHDQKSKYFFIIQKYKSMEIFYLVQL